MAGEILPAERFARLDVARTKMPPIYRAADLLVLSSPLESGALVVLEAMASNTPVVTTADPVRRYLVGEAGVLVEGRSSTDFAAGIHMALQTDWGNRPREQALRFSVAEAADRYAELLGDLARERS